MKTFEAIRRWINGRYARIGHPPAFVPISRSEMCEIQTDAPIYQFTPKPESENRVEIAGVKGFITEYAAEMRVRTIDLQVEPFTELSKFDDSLCIYEDRRDKFDGMMLRSFKTSICTDTTKIRVTIEWDILAWLKRKLRVTRWFPVNMRTIENDGRVLYPYLKISLPTNRHHVQFQVRE